MSSTLWSSKYPSLSSRRYCSAVQRQRHTPASRSLWGLGAISSATGSSTVAIALLLPPVILRHIIGEFLRAEFHCKLGEPRQAIDEWNAHPVLADQRSGVVQEVVSDVDPG